MKMMVILEYTNVEQIKWVTKFWGQAEEFPEDFATYPYSNTPSMNGTLLFRVHDAANNCEYQLFEGDDLGDLMKIYAGFEAQGNMVVTRFPVLDDREWWENARKRYTNNPEHYQEEE